MSINDSGTSDPTCRIYRLLDITNLIKSSLINLSQEKFWVQAHLHVNRAGLKGGHFYCDLVDIDDRGNQIAKIRGTIWSARYNAIKNKLKDAGFPNALQDNSENCVLCSVRYHELYGLSIDISDVDPTFGEAQINRNRRLIIEILTKEGILKNNVETYLSAAALKIGLISSKGSAAYSDFIKTLFSSDYSFKVIFMESSMQGEKTESDIIAGIEKLEKARVDIICIVRGGGSQADLAWFDNERIARKIINCSIPVWVGIGHEIDAGVLDVVAHTTHKTPTAVAEALVSRIQDLSIRLDVAKDRLKHITERRITLHESSLQRNIQGGINGLRKYFTIIDGNIKNYILQIEARFISKFKDKENILDTKRLLIQDKSFAIVKDHEKELVGYLSNLKSLTEYFQHSKLEFIRGKIDKLILLSRRDIQQREAKLQKNIQGASVGFYKYFSLVFERFEKNLVRTDSRLMRCFSDKVNKLNQMTISLYDRCYSMLKNSGRILYEKTTFLSSSFSHYEMNVTKQTTEISQRLYNLYQKYTQLKVTNIFANRNRFQLSRYLKIVSDREKTLIEKTQRVNSLKPENVLKKGYSITKDITGQVIKSINQIKEGQNIVTHYSDGFSESIITKKGE